MVVVPRLSRRPEFDACLSFLEITSRQVRETVSRALLSSYRTLYMTCFSCLASFPVIAATFWSPIRYSVPGKNSSSFDSLLSIIPNGMMKFLDEGWFQFDVVSRPESQC